MQWPNRVDIIDEPAAASEKTKVLDAFDRVADVGIRLAFMFHVACVAGSRSRDRLRVEPHAGEFPLRELFHRVAYAFAAKARRPDAAERIAVEPEAAGIIDPERADPQLARDLERGLEVRGEAGALQSELGCIGDRERCIDIGDRLYDHHGAERLLDHEPDTVGRLRHDCWPENAAAALGL